MILNGGKILNWGIIGCGDVTEKKSGPAFSLIEGSRLLAVMRRTANLAEDFAKRHDVPEWYNDARSIIEHPDIDAVYIATPPNFHDEYAIACMEAGKAIYVEKPMATTYTKCLGMVKRSNELKKPLFVAYYRRSLDYFRKIKEMIDGSVIGEIETITLQLHKPISRQVRSSEKPWRVIPEIAGGGYFFDLACHQLDILNYFFGIPIQYSGSARNKAGYYEAEDEVRGRLTYPGNITAKCSWNFHVNKFLQKDCCTINGTEGKITFSFFSFNPIIVKHNNKIKRIVINRPAVIQQQYIQSIVDELLRKGHCPGTLVSALTTNKIMEKFTHNYYCR